MNDYFVGGLPFLVYFLFFHNGLQKQKTKKTLTAETFFFNRKKQK